MVVSHTHLKIPLMLSRLDQFASLSSLDMATSHIMRLKLEFAALLALWLLTFASALYWLFT